MHKLNQQQQQYQQQPQQQQHHYNLRNVTQRQIPHYINTQPEIIHAVIRNDLDHVKRIVSSTHSKEWKYVDQNRRTPLHLAASLGHDDILRLLIDRDCSVNFRDNALITPLHRACRNNRVHCVHLLINARADVNAKNRHHLTPLHICAKVGALDSAKLIIEHVANIDATDAFGATALHHAVYNGHFDIIQLLLEYGAKVDVQDKFGQRPIHYAAMVPDPSILRLLVEQAGADVNVRNKYFQTPLHLAVAHENLNVFNELIDYNANLDAQDIHGNTIAHWASYYGYMPIFERVSQKMKMNLPNLNGVTPLHFACSSRSNESCDVVEELLKFDNNLEILDKLNRTPLHYSAINGLDCIAHMLIIRGSNFNACDSELEAPIHKAVRNIHLDMVNLLNEFKANINISNKDGLTPLHLAAWSNSPQFCKVLIDAGADPMKWDSSGRTPHFMAVYKGSLDCFFELMSSPLYKEILSNDENHHQNYHHEYPILFPELDAFKRSLLHYACASKFPEVCREDFLQILLLKSDFKRFESLDPMVIQALKVSLGRLDINQQDIYGRTPLHYLCRRSNENQNEMEIVSLIRLLVDNGANFSIRDNSNRFPFHYAVANGYTSALCLLIDRKWFQSIDIYRRVFHSVSCPLKIAAYHGHCMVLNELLNYGFTDFDEAFEIACRRSNWNCVHRLMSVVHKHKLLMKMGYYTALKGDIEGLRFFIDPLARHLDRLLFFSCYSKDGTSCVEMLLLKGVNVNVRDPDGCNALFYAVAGGNRQTIQLLLQSGIRFVRNRKNQNVFHLAAKRCDLETFALISNFSKSFGYYGLLCNLLLSRDNDGFTPLEIACMNRCQSILEYYINNIDRGHTEKLMFFSGLVGNLPFVEYLLNKNGFTFLHASGPYGRNLMHYCCMSDQKDFSMLKLLIDLNFDVNQPDQEGYTPFLWAAAAANSDTIDYLLENTCVNFLAKNFDGNTALHLACDSGQTMPSMKIIKYAKEKKLIDKLIYEKNHLKQTPLHIAAKRSLPKIIEELIELGSNFMEEDQCGYTPSLYCTNNRKQAYCLIIIESYMGIDIPSYSKNEISSSKTSKDEFEEHDPDDNVNDGDDDKSNNNNNEEKIVMVNGMMKKNDRLSLPPIIESRKSRMSLNICDKFRRLSLNNHPRDQNYGSNINNINNNNNNNNSNQSIDNNTNDTVNSFGSEEYDEDRIFKMNNGLMMMGIDDSDLY